MGNTHTHRIRQPLQDLDENVYGFNDSLVTNTEIDHCVDIIELGDNWYIGTDEVDHSVTLPRVLGFINRCDIAGKTIDAYRERMILDPMFPAIEQTIREDTSGFLSSDSESQLKWRMEYGMLGQLLPMKFCAYTWSLLTAPNPFQKIWMK